VIYRDTRGFTHTSQEIDSLTRQDLRDYQRELFYTLVFLPTGSGKTLLAAMALSCMKKLNPDKLMVFLVHRIPLVYQQSDYIKSQVPDLKVGTLVGEMEPPQQKAMHKNLAEQEIDVLVLTYQILLNFLAEKENPVTQMSAAALQALLQTRGRASRRRDSKFAMICNEKEKQEAEDAILKKKNMKEAIKYLMSNKKLKSQAEEFGCELKPPNFSLPSTN